jgi:hypothetical protein
MVDGRHRVSAKFQFTTSAIVTPFSHVSVRFIVYVDGVEKASTSTYTYSAAGVTYAIEESFPIDVDVSDVGTFIHLEVEIGNPISNHAVSVTMQPASYIMIDALDNSAINLYANSYNVKNHVPDMTVREFLKCVMDEFNVSYHLNEGFNEITIVNNANRLAVASTDITTKARPDHQAILNTSRIKSISYEWPSDDALLQDNFKTFDLNGDLGAFNGVVNFPLNPMPGQTARDLNSNVRYIATNQPGTVLLAWEILGDDYYPYVFNATYEREFKIKIPPLLMYYDDDLIRYLPHISQPGSSEAFGLGVTPSSPRSIYLYQAATPYIAQLPDQLIEMDGDTPVQLLLRHYNWTLVCNSRFVWEKFMNLEYDDITELTSVDGIFNPVKIDNMEFIIITVGKFNLYKCLWNHANCFSPSITCTS